MMRDPLNEPMLVTIVLDPPRARELERLIAATMKQHPAMREDGIVADVLARGIVESWVQLTRHATQQHVHEAGLCDAAAQNIVNLWEGRRG